MLDVLLHYIDWPNTARVAVLMGIVVATSFLLRKKITAPAYTAVIGGLALLWVACNVDLKGASRIVVAGFEIDRRVEMAEQAIRRLEALEASAQQTANKIQGLIDQMHKLESHQRPRTLTAAQQHMLIQQLREGPKGQFAITVAIGDPEANHFAKQFDLVLKDAGWTRDKMGFWPGTDIDEDYGPETLLGLMIDVGRAELAPHGEFLRQALHAVGIDVEMRVDLPVPETLVRLVVGHKPWPQNREVSQQDHQP
jgi:hypothetical protein